MRQLLAATKRSSVGQLELAAPLWLAAARLPGSSATLVDSSGWALAQAALLDPKVPPEPLAPTRFAPQKAEANTLVLAAGAWVSLVKGGGRSARELRRATDAGRAGQVRHIVLSCMFPAPNVVKASCPRRVLALAGRLPAAAAVLSAAAAGGDGALGGCQDCLLLQAELSAEGKDTGGGGTAAHPRPADEYTGFRLPAKKDGAWRPRKLVAGELAGLAEYIERREPALLHVESTKASCCTPARFIALSFHCCHASFANAGVGLPAGRCGAACVAKLDC